ncbi:MAG: hypothetical protein IPL46_00095 [Saprospiraceae bacterium]|nr:hypothetical protein [Saprospiraceae bacterium]
MRKILLLPLVLVLFVTCQKEDNIQKTPVQANNLHPKTFKTPEDVFSFLSQEMPDVYTPEEISHFKTMVQEPEETDHARSGNTVELPAGSVDALQAAVEEADEGGTVIVKAGDHIENGWINIGHKIRIIGEQGAKISLDNDLLEAIPDVLAGGILFENADNSIVEGIEFSGLGDGAGIGILINNSNRVRIAKNTFTNIQFPITIDHGDHCTIRRNKMTLDLALLENPAGSDGITNINGRNAAIVENEINGALFGIFASARGGLDWGNTTENCFFGQIICNFFGANYPDGTELKAEESGNHWLVALNDSKNNFYGGIVVIDGAFKNTLLANTGSGNGAYDVDLVGATERFGFLTPTSSGNRVYSYNDQTIKDCGENNKVIGGIMVDTSVDPCDNVE